MRVKKYLSAISIALLFLASTTPAFAETKTLGPQSASLKDGLYLGGQFGYDSYRIDFSGINNFDGSSENSGVNPTGFVGGLFAGYGQYFDNRYYLGGEVFVNDSAATATSTTTYTMPRIGSISDRYNINWSTGIALIPGLKLNNTSLLYTRLGYNAAKMKITEIGSNQFGAPSYTVSVFNTSQGFVYGVGIETLIFQNWSIRGEFDHINYSSFTPKGSGFKFNPVDNQFMLGLIYHFG